MIGTVEVDSSGDYILIFPDELIAKVDWQIGDSLEWLDQGDGSFILRKVEPNDL
jgi:hypothetical protein